MTDVILHLGPGFSNSRELRTSPCQQGSVGERGCVLYVAMIECYTPHTHSRIHRANADVDQVFHLFDFCGRMRTRRQHMRGRTGCGPSAGIYPSIVGQSLRRRTSAALDEKILCPSDT